MDAADWFSDPSLAKPESKPNKIAPEDPGVNKRAQTKIKISSLFKKRDIDKELKKLEQKNIAKFSS